MQMKDPIYHTKHLVQPYLWHLLFICSIFTSISAVVGQLSEFWEVHLLKACLAAIRHH